jgi:deoxyribonuclease-4
MYTGAHIKKESGSLIRTIKVIQQRQGNALQLFVSNPRSASLPNFESYHSMSEEVREYCRATDFKLIVHSSYTVNLSKEPMNGKKRLELKDCYWINLLLHELIVSEMLGSAGVVVHVGKHTTNTPEKGLDNMFAAMKYIVGKLREGGMHTKLILETPAGAGTELLKTAEEFIAFYNRFSTDEKRYLGICIDTAHVWSSGYDIIDYYTKVIQHNAKDIIVIHFNNSKKEQGSNTDAHESILVKNGKIPLAQLVSILKAATSLKSAMIILETPNDTLVEEEIKWIHSMIR